MPNYFDITKICCEIEEEKRRLKNWEKRKRMCSRIEQIQNAEQVPRARKHIRELEDKLLEYPIIREACNRCKEKVLFT